MKRYGFFLSFVFSVVMMSQAQAYYQPVPPFTPVHPGVQYPTYPAYPPYPVYPIYPQYPTYGGFFCGTPIGSCPIAPGPVGIQCYCNTWNGPVYGNVFVVR